MYALVVLLAQVAIPPPRGYVNDFAGVLDSAAIAHMTAVIAEVKNATRGEIAVVTLSDIGGRAASDVADQIGRQWGVGATGEAGDPAKNLGVVVLLVPRKNHRPGTGDIFIATGRGAEGFHRPQWGTFAMPCCCCSRRSSTDLPYRSASISARRHSAENSA
jgi:uncharacterized protein